MSDDKTPTPQLIAFLEMQAGAYALKVRGELDPGVTYSWDRGDELIWEAAQRLRGLSSEVGGDNTETQVVIIHTGDQDDRLAAWNEGFAEAMRQNGEPDDGGKAMREFLAAHDAELTEKVRAAAIEEAAQVVLNYEPSFTTHRFVIAAIAALTGAAAAIRTLSITPEPSNT